MIAYICSNKKWEEKIEQKKKKNWNEKKKLAEI